MCAGISICILPSKNLLGSTKSFLYVEMWKQVLCSERAATIGVRQKNMKQWCRRRMGMSMDMSALTMSPCSVPNSFNLLCTMMIHYTFILSDRNVDVKAFSYWCVSWCAVYLSSLSCALLQTWSFCIVPSNTVCPRPSPSLQHDGEIPGCAWFCCMVHRLFFSNATLYVLFTIIG